MTIVVEQIKTLKQYDELIANIKYELEYYTKKLNELRKDRWKHYLASTTDGIEERFNTWVKTEAATVHKSSYIEILASSGRVFNTEEILPTERYQTVNAESIAYTFKELLEELNRKNTDTVYETKYIYDAKKDKFVYKISDEILYTRQDIYDWMQWLIDNDLASYYNNW